MTIFSGDLAPGITKFGRNSDVGGEEDVVEGGVVTFPSAAGQLTVVSSSVNDDIEGTHARTVKIMYLDGDGIPREETVDLDGTTPVVVAASSLFAYRHRCITFGATKSNAGLITAKIGSAVVAVTPIGFIQTQVAAMKVPAIYSYANIKEWGGYTERVSTVTGEIGLLIQEPGEEGFAVRWTLPLRGEKPTEVFEDNDMIEVPALSNIKLRVLEISAANTLVAGSFTLRYKP